MSRINRSKYNFSKIAMGDSFTVEPLDVISMKNSLRFYNNKHNKNITVSTDEQPDGKILVTRIAPKVKNTLTV